MPRKNISLSGQQVIRDLGIRISEYLRFFFRKSGSPDSQVPNHRITGWSSLALCILSSLLLTLSFPQTDFWLLAWIGLIPFLFSLDGKKPLASFMLGYLTGVMFFAGTLYWFIHVTVPGAVLLILYFAVYFGLFALSYVYFSPRSFIARLFLLPGAWVAIEFIRGHLLSGFGWVSLGHSQYKNLLSIQIADITGAAGVSFLVMMVNVLLKELAGLRLKNERIRVKHPVFYSIFVVLGLLAACGMYGAYRLNQVNSARYLNIAVIQANIPQELKWQRSFWPSIMQKYLNLTREAARERPDLILWPETAFPGFIWEAPQLFEALKDFTAELKTPLLLGVVTQINEDYYNSALLISERGEVIKQYDKLHLVPFGEYVPLRNILPFLAAIVPIGDFTPGQEYTLFPARPLNDAAQKKTQDYFSVLICFEDTIPEISRGFTKAGAQLLINITNDAWFKDTKAPFLHMQASVFRTVENRRNLVRSANTGVSCFIDEHGKILSSVRDEKGKKTYVPGYRMERAALHNNKTFYTKYGDVFTYLCFGSILLGVLKRR